MAIFFNSCKEDSQSSSVNNVKYTKTITENPSIIIQAVNEASQDTSIWEGSGTYHDEFAWYTSFNKYFGYHYYGWDTFGERILKRISENSFMIYDPVAQTEAILENIVISEDSLSLEADYKTDSITRKLFLKDSSNKYQLYDIKIGEEIALSEAIFNSKVIPILVAQGIYYTCVLVASTIVYYCDQQIQAEATECARNGWCSETIAGCHSRCFKCKPKQ